MKLSEKLASIEEQDRAAAPAVGASATRRSVATRSEQPKPRRGSPNRSASKRRVRDLVRTELAPKMARLQGDALANEVKLVLDKILQREDVKVSPLERRRFLQEMLQDILGYGPLDPLLEDISITEIMCNSFDNIWIERDGRLEATEASFTDDDQYRQVIEKIVSAVGRRIDESSPMVDARLPDGSRVNAVVPPLAIHGPVLTIRKFAADPYTVKDLINFGSFSLDLAVVLQACVPRQLNVVVSGGTGTGKTTTLNVLSAFIPDGERIVTIEDSAELQLRHPHITNLKARPPQAE